MANARTQFDALASSLLLQHDEVTQASLAGRPCLSLAGEAFLVLYRENVAFRLAGNALARAMALAGATGFDPMKPDDRNAIAPGWILVPVAHWPLWESLAQDAMASARRAQVQNVSWQAPPPTPEPGAEQPPSSTQSLSDRASAALKSGFGFDLKQDG